MAFVWNRQTRFWNQTGLATATMNGCSGERWLAERRLSIIINFTMDIGAESHYHLVGRWLGCCSMPGMMLWHLPFSPDQESKRLLFPSPSPISYFVNNSSTSFRAISKEHKQQQRRRNCLFYIWSDPCRYVTRMYAVQVCCVPCKRVCFTLRMNAPIFTKGVVAVSFFFCVVAPSLGNLRNLFVPGQRVDCLNAAVKKSRALIELLNVH